MKIKEIKGNLKTWQEQRDSLISKLNKLDERTEEIGNKVKEYEQEHGDE